MLKQNFVSSLLWLLLVAISVPLGYALGNFLTGNSSDSHDTPAATIIVVLLVVGLFIGFGQWIAINRRLKVVWTWIRLQDC